MRYLVLMAFLAASVSLGMAIHAVGEEKTDDQLRIIVEQAHVKVLIATRELAVVAANMENEQKGLIKDTEMLRKEIANLDKLLGQLEDQQLAAKKRLAELYRTNTRLREKMEAKLKKIRHDDNGHLESNEAESKESTR